MKKGIILSTIATVAMLFLMGCGGDPKGNLEDNPAAVTEINGTAVDDLILNGKVAATTPSGTELAKGRTSATDGSYALKVTHTGIVLISVTCDGDSTMLNPVTKVTQACESDVELHSLADVKAGEPQTVHISPLTEMVYERAKAQASDASSVTASEFEKARAEIGVAFGVDPIADDPSKGSAAKVIGAIHDLAEKDDKTVMEITKSLAEELADGSADGAADETVSALTKIMADENITNNLVDNNGTYTPPEHAAAVSDIDAAKALFTELRTQAMSVVDYNQSGTPGFLDKEAEAMQKALNEATLNVDYVGYALGKITEEIGNAYEQNLTDINATFEYGEVYGADGREEKTRTITLQRTGVGAWTYSIADEASHTWSGTVSLPEDFTDKEKVEDALYTAGTQTMDINGTVPLYYIGWTKEGVEDSQSFEGNVTVTKKAAEGVISADISLVGKVANNGTSVELKNATAELVYTKGTAKDAQSIAEPVFNYFKLHNVVLQGKIGVYTIDGNLTVNSYVQNKGWASKGGLFETQSNYSYSSTHIRNSGWLPNDITFAGAIKRTGASLEGTLKAKWLNADTIDLDSVIDRYDLGERDSMPKPFVKVDVSGKLQMPDRPEMLATLAFENNATHNTIGASYTYDSTVINLSALFDSNMSNGDIAITTHTGLRADIKMKERHLMTDGNSTVTKDGALVGTIENRTWVTERNNNSVPVIKYVDGSFESLP